MGVSYGEEDIDVNGAAEVNLRDATGAEVLGQKVSASSLPVVIASNQSAVPVSQSGTWTVQPGNTANTTPWLVEVRPTTLVTYSASAVGLVSAATATDIFTLTGSATKTIRITRIEISGTTTAGSGLGVNVQLIKRSTANSGGTSSTLTAVPMDSTNAAGTAVARSYTANPTLGTTVGTVRAVRYDFVATGALDNVLTWEFGSRPAQELALRGTSEVVAVNLSSTSITGPVIDISIEWTEE